MTNIKPVGQENVMDKCKLTERDICTQFITPALHQAGWDAMSQIREEVNLTGGRIGVRGKLVYRERARRADYVLYSKPNIPLAVIEAKNNTSSVGDGIQRALDYAEMLQVPFAFSSNGNAFLFHDRSGTAMQCETELALGEFPAPDELWDRYRVWKGIAPEDEKIVLQDYHDDGSGRTPRYYQTHAINATVEAIAKEQSRLLLVVATGTGKTCTAFQILWRLWKAGRRKRILFPTDRNVLVDQTMVNVFRPFGSAMTKLSSRAGTIQREAGSALRTWCSLQSLPRPLSANPVSRNTRRFTVASPRPLRSDRRRPMPSRELLRTRSGGRFSNNSRPLLKHCLLS